MSPERASATQFEKVLGVSFFTGPAAEAVERLHDGGLLVAPAAPALKDLDRNAGYREAILQADLVLPDSAFMILVWNRLFRGRMRRLSGLEYLVQLLRDPVFRQHKNALWVMAGEQSAERNAEWLAARGVLLTEETTYLAPQYGAVIDDPVLLSRVRALRPAHIIVTIGGGNQERLGLYLKRNLDYLPGIHCIGAAIAFLSGDQVRIPMWADRLYLGWLFRSLSEPKRYFPRYWEARKLYALMRRYGSELPPLAP